MSSIFEQQPITDKNQVKVFILYLMHEIGYPLSYTYVNDIVAQDGFVAHIDFVIAFAECLETGLIEICGKDEREDDLYQTTQKGMIVAEQLAGKLGSNLLKTSIRSAMRYIDFQKRHVTLECDDTMIADGSVEVHLLMKDNTKTLLSITINVANAEQAEFIIQRFYERPEATYRGLHGLLNGNIDFLFDEKKELG